jgi:ferredoxin
MSTTASARVGIALCGDAGGTGRLDLGMLAPKLEELAPDACVEVVPDLCHGPDRVPEAASRTGAKRLVLGLCARPEGTEEFQAWTRKAGLDPFAVELVDLQGASGVDDAALLLAAAVARLEAFTGSEPEQLKLRLASFEQRRSRRSLFTLPPVTYTAVPSITDENCLGEQRCGLCIPTCPFSAIRRIGGRAVVEKESCESCGLCVTACPTRAIAFPGSSLPQYEAQISALLSARRPQLTFACRKAVREHDPDRRGGLLSSGWLPVEVPCAGMVTPGWVLQALAAGASRVALLSCSDCGTGSGTVLADRVEFCQDVLRLLGDGSPADRVVLDLPPDEAEPPRDPEGGRPSRQSRPLTLSEPAATAEGLLALHERYGTPPTLSLSHPGVALGLVTLREDTCTACGACALACPTGALVFEGTVLSFDAARCVACERCVPACPEAADETLTVRRATDLAALAKGRTVLKSGAVARCRLCGRPVAAEAMLDRIRTLLGDGEGADRLLGVVTELCVDCRGLDFQATVLPLAQRSRP